MNGRQKKLVEAISDVQQGRVSLEEGQARERLQRGESGTAARGGGGGRREEGERRGGGGDGRGLGGGEECASTADASTAHVV